jgi:hypothetical protein
LAKIAMATSAMTATVARVMGLLDFISLERMWLKIRVAA